jgi:LDH2 family malate/lactate/ureidoglycolate dehydrogenase
MFQGQCFIAINPEVFAPGFSERLEDLMNICRELDPVSTLA